MSNGRAATCARPVIPRPVIRSVERAEGRAVDGSEVIVPERRPGWPRYRSNGTSI
jgi:hypothetical protein